MAEREVAVRLTANTTQYVSGMKQAEQATEKLSGSSSTNLSKLGSDLSSVGGSLTRSVTLPLVGAGAAAIKLGNDFNSSFGQMVGLAGIPADEVDRLKESVLDLAGETAQAPQDLAEALYAAASSGLDSAQAMQAVEVAARAAAAGMGRTQDIVGLVASATASYGAANIDAARATDILTAAIREGRADPEELAGTLGRVLPVAASLGVEFEEVAGITAYMSNIFGDTDRTVTGVNDTLAKLAAPADSARAALEAAGTSAEELQDTIRNDGLLAGLELLREKGFAGNSAAIRELMPDMQGAATLTALLNDESGSLADTLGSVADSTGSLDSAYGAIDQNAQAVKQAWVDMQIALIQIGDTLAPIFADLTSDAAGLVSAFADLPEPVQKIAIGLAAFAAAGGPVLILMGSMIRNVTTLRTAMSAGQGGLAYALGGVTLAITVAAGAYLAYNDRKRQAAERTATFVELLKQEASGQEAATTQMLVAKYASDQWTDAMEAAGLSLTDVSRFIQGESVPALQELVDAQNDIGIAGTEMNTRFGENAQAVLNLVRNIGVQREAYVAATEEEKRRTDALKGSTAAVDAAKRQQSEYVSGLRGMAETVENTVLKENSHKDVLVALTNETSRFTFEQRAAKQELDATADAIADVEAAFARLKDELSDRAAYLGVKDAFDQVEVAAVEAWDAASAGAEDTEQKLRDAERAQLDLKSRVVEYIDSVEGIPPERATEILALIDEGKLAEAEAKLAHIERVRYVNVELRVSDANIRVNANGRLVGGAATGVQNARAGAWLVGEDGPEIVDLPNGADVVPHHRSLQMLEAGSKMSPISFSPQQATVAAAAHTTYHAEVNHYGTEADVDTVSRALQMAELSR